MENPIDEATTVAEMLQRPAVSADPRVVGAVSAQLQVVGAAPFRMAMGPERIYGTFNLTRRIDQTDHRYENVSKAGMKRPAASFERGWHHQIKFLLGTVRM